MSAVTSRALREQLSVIMGALTKAALAEICEAVDEGFALLQMEISRSHKENQDLKKKLHLIESIVVRGGGGGGGGGGTGGTGGRAGRGGRPAGGNGSAAAGRWRRRRRRCSRRSRGAAAGGGERTAGHPVSSGTSQPLV